MKEKLIGIGCLLFGALIWIVITTSAVSAQSNYSFSDYHSALLSSTPGIDTGWASSNNIATIVTPSAHLYPILHDLLIYEDLQNIDCPLQTYSCYEQYLDVFNRQAKGLGRARQFSGELEEILVSSVRQAALEIAAQLGSRIQINSSTLTDFFTIANASQRGDEFDTLRALWIRHRDSLAQWHLLLVPA